MGRFATEYLLNIRVDDNNWNSHSVDLLLHDYKLLSDNPGLHLDEDYVLNLGGNNAAPSTAGSASQSILENLGWSGSGGITITTGSG